MTYEEEEEGTFIILYFIKAKLKNENNNKIGMQKIRNRDSGTVTSNLDNWTMKH